MDVVQYPKFKYHATKAARIVNDDAEEQELGSEWKDSPAEFGVITCPSAEDLQNAEAVVEDNAAEQETTAPKRKTK